MKVRFLIIFGLFAFVVLSGCVTQKEQYICTGSSYINLKVDNPNDCPRLDVKIDFPDVVKLIDTRGVSITTISAGSGKGFNNQNFDGKIIIHNPNKFDVTINFISYNDVNAWTKIPFFFNSTIDLQKMHDVISAGETKEYNVKPYVNGGFINDLVKDPTLSFTIPYKILVSYTWGRIENNNMGSNPYGFNQANSNESNNRYQEYTEYFDTYSRINYSLDENEIGLTISNIAPPTFDDLPFSNKTYYVIESDRVGRALPSMQISIKSKFIESKNITFDFKCSTGTSTLDSSQGKFEIPKLEEKVLDGRYLRVENSDLTSSAGFYTAELTPTGASPDTSISVMKPDGEATFWMNLQKNSIGKIKVDCEVNINFEQPVIHEKRFFTMDFE